MLRERFDYILGNPPWLSYRYISDPEYQAEVKRRAAEDYEIAPKSQKLFTQMELATVFLLHSLKTFGRAGARLAFVMPRAVLTADQHHNLRIRKYRAPVELTGYWDLREVSPLFNVPSCVLFAKRTADRPRSGNEYTLPAVEWQGRLKRQDCRWTEAELELKPRPRRARVIFLAERSALSTARGSTRPTKGSDYAREFHQGATIVPRSFYFVRLFYPESAAKANYVNWAVTDEEQAASAKPPYREVAFRGEIEGHYLFSTAIARHVLPFLHLEPATVVLPLTVDERGALTVRNEEELRHAGHDGVATWMRKAEAIWAKAQGRKAGRQTIYERLDYQRELTRQNLNARHLILYNAAGTHLAAARLDRKTLPLRFVVEHKLYWRACATIAEADYLAAVLNSREVNRRIKPFQSQGLLGERDIEKKALELPIPRFDRADNAHRRLAALGARARREAAAVVERADLPAALGRRRAAIRTALAGTLDEIDTAVRELLDSV